MANPRIPPNDLEAEQSVLGALLIDKDAIVEVAEFLRPEHFYKESHGKIYSAMLSLYEKREPIDVVTLSTALKKGGAQEQAGGIAYLSELANKVPTSANVETYGRIVKSCSTKRDLIKVAGVISEEAFSETTEVSGVLEKAESSIFSISQENLTRNFVPIKDALAESFDRLDELEKKAGGLRGVPTGFKDLDNKLAGMQDSNLLILAARPGIGKTAFILNVAHFAAMKAKVPVGIFSLEMSKEELVDRLLVSEADIDAWKYKVGRLDDSDFDKLQEAYGVLADVPLYIDDTPGINVSEMRTKARRLQVEFGLKLLVVDYLQLVDPGRRYDNRVVEVSMVSQALKNLARELKVPVLAVSQLSRAVEARGTKVPQLADLRESGAIEQDADVVMFLYRSEDEIKDSSQILTKLLIAKHRNGPLGEIDLMFVGDRIMFHGVERRREKKEETELLGVAI